MQQLLRFSTDALPERDRLSIWTEVFGRYIVKVQLEPAGSHAFSQNATLRSLPGLSLASMSVSGFHTTRTSREIADGDDSLNFIINIAGTSKYRQLDREAVVSSHEAVLMSGVEKTDGLCPEPSRALMINVPRQVIAAMVGDPEAMLCRTLPRSEALRLLISYLQSTAPLSLKSSGLGLTYATHLQDLMALAIGASRDGAEIARGRGGRAARLAAIKLDIERYGRNDLTITALALRHGVTPRYIQKLFETEGTTFTSYVMEQRLLEASRMLADPQFADHNIGEVALKVGFGDLPYFTRSFRRRFGMTPSDAREQARRGPPAGDDPR